MSHILASNKKGYFNYSISEEFEAGIILKGFEVKSIKNKEISLDESYIKIENNEAWVYGMNIAKWKFDGISEEYNPIRRRKLLLKRQELKEIDLAFRLKKLQIIPLKVFLKRGKVKLKVGIGKGRKKYDKREQLKSKEYRKNDRSSGDTW